MFTLAAVPGVSRGVSGRFPAHPHTFAVSVARGPLARTRAPFGRHGPRKKATSMMLEQCGSLSSVEALKVKVQGGRLKLDEPTDLPEGTVLELVLAGDVEELDEAERAALLQSIDEGAEDFENGDAEDALVFAQSLMAASA